MKSTVVRVLLNHKQIQVNLRSTDGASALYQASRYGLLDIVSELLKHPTVDVNSGPLDKKTPLMAATIHRYRS